MSETIATITSTEPMDQSRYLLFYIGEAFYGIPLALVLEIIDIQNITHLPCVADYIKGIVNLRGQIVPVIDVRLKFQMTERAYDEKTCIIILECHEMQVGLIVDSVVEVVTVESCKLARPPAVGDLDSRYLSSVAEVGDKVILNIDFEQFFQIDINPIF
ncbi:MAG: chemotaxis protein CheW [Evtepia sp.]